jgi:hypothetical protein
MKLNTLFVIMAVFCLVWGAGFILLPVQIWGLYGLSLDSGGIFMSRQFGATFFMLGLIIWLARKDAGSWAYRAIISGLFIGNLLSLGVFLVRQLSGTINALGWSAITAYAFLAGGFGYYLLKPAGSPTEAKTFS